mgnify:CR=1 FL=1
MKGLKYLVVLLFIASCSCAQQREERNLPEFRGLGINGNFTVTLVKSKTSKVLVESSAPLDKIVTEVNNGILNISLKKNSFSGGKITIYYVNNLESISLNGSAEVRGMDLMDPENLEVSVRGSGDIFLNALKVKQLSASVAGSGDIKLKGSSEQADFSVAGSGDINAFDFETVNANISIAGSGDVTANVTGNINVTIAGSGDVIYKGNPKVGKVSIAGSGSFVKQ